MTEWEFQEALWNERHTLRKNAWFAGVAMVAVLTVQLIAGVVAAPFLLQAEAQMTASVAHRMFYYLFYIGYYVFMLLFPVAITALAFRCRPGLPRAFRRRVPPLFAVLLIAFGMAFCVLANYLVNYWLQAISFFGIEPYQGGYNNDAGLLPLVLNLLTYALIPGVVEEVVFRGFLLGALQPFGERRALLLSALLFGLAHLNFTQMPFAFLLGLFFGFVFLRTGRLWPCMMVHFLNNAMSVVLEYLHANAGLGEEQYMALQIAVFAVLVLVGAVAGLLLYTHPTDSGLVRVLTDHRHVTTAATRSRGMWLNPAIITATVVWTAFMLLQEVAMP